MRETLRISWWVALLVAVSPLFSCRKAIILRDSRKILFPTEEKDAPEAVAPQEVWPDDPLARGEPAEPTASQGGSSVDGLTRLPVGSAEGTRIEFGADAPEAARGGSISIPAGAVSIDTELVVADGAPVATGDSLAALGIEAGATAASASLVVVPADPDAVLTSPMTLSIAVPDQAGAGLVERRLAVLFKAIKSGKIVLGILPPGDVSASAGLVSFETAYFGTFQAIWVSGDVERREVETSETSILTKSGAAAAQVKPIDAVTDAAQEDDVHGVDAAPEPTLTISSVVVNFASGQGEVGSIGKCDYKLEGAPNGVVISYSWEVSDADGVFRQMSGETAQTIELTVEDFGWLPSYRCVVTAATPGRPTVQEASAVSRDMLMMNTLGSFDRETDTVTAHGSGKVGETSLTCDIAWADADYVVPRIQTMWQRSTGGGPWVTVWDGWEGEEPFVITSAPENHGHPLFRCRRVAWVSVHNYIDAMESQAFQVANSAPAIYLSFDRSPWPDVLTYNLSAVESDEVTVSSVDPDGDATYLGTYWARAESDPDRDSTACGLDTERSDVSPGVWQVIVQPLIFEPQYVPDVCSGALKFFVDDANGGTSERAMPVEITRQ